MFSCKTTGPHHSNGRPPVTGGDDLPCPHESYVPGRRELVAPNLYRRRTKTGESRFDDVFHDADGRKRFKVLDAPNQRVAEREARRLLAERDQGERVVAANVTLRAFVEQEFQPHIESLASAGRRSAQGVTLDKNHLRLYILPTLGDLRLGTITGADVATLLRELRLRQRRLSESSIHHTVCVLRSLYRLAKARRIVTRSPLDDLDDSERPRRLTTKVGRRLDEAELSLLVAHAGEGTYQMAIALLAYTGCRISEASRSVGRTSTTSTPAPGSRGNSRERRAAEPRGSCRARAARAIRRRSSSPRSPNG